MYTWSRLRHAWGRVGWGGMITFFACGHGRCYTIVMLVDVCTWLVLRHASIAFLNGLWDGILLMSAICEKKVLPIKKTAHLTSMEGDQRRWLLFVAGNGVRWELEIGGCACQWR